MQIVELEASQVDIANDLMKLVVMIAILMFFNTFFVFRFKASMISSPVTFVGMVYLLTLFVVHFGVDKFVRFVPKTSQESAYFVARRRS